MVTRGGRNHYPHRAREKSGNPNTNIQHQFLTLVPLGVRVGVCGKYFLWGIGTPSRPRSMHRAENPRLHSENPGVEWYDQGIRFGVIKPIICPFFNVMGKRSADFQPSAGILLNTSGFHENKLYHNSGSTKSFSPSYTG